MANQGRKERLEFTVTAIQKRWGTVQRAKEQVNLLAEKGWRVQ
jgi:cytochrome c biogenesis protein ResB